MHAYGNYDRNEQYTPETVIWGHRLREGQEWIEYLLEFLAVLAGYNYSFGVYTDEYIVPKRLGLRRFVFYDENEKSPDPRDEDAVKKLKERIVHYVQANGYPVEDIIQQIRSLIRSFAIIEKNRSWYAKSLFPVHEEFILWEALRKGSKRNTYRDDLTKLSLHELDKGVEFFARNFFARGGELYYLMISAGTATEPSRRERIANRFKTLLRDSHRTLGRIASIINQAWVDLTKSDVKAEDIVKGKPGWLPDPTCPLYTYFAEDLDNLLDNQLDELECLELVAHLICFHIIIYIYHRAHPQNCSDSTLHQSGRCLQVCRPEILIDLPGDNDGQIIRSISANLLKRHERWQIDQVRHFVQNRVTLSIHQQPNAQPIDIVERLADEYFGNIRQSTRSEFQKSISKLRQRATKMKNEEIVEELINLMYDALASNFHRHFLGIHRRLGRAIGLIAPQRGPQPRFVLGDTLLKTLTMVIVPPSGSLPFGTFLERLYRRYGIIIGPGEAKQTDLIHRFAVNEGAFASNRDRFLNRMKSAGLLTQYSDATAMVHRP